MTRLFRSDDVIIQVQDGHYEHGGEAEGRGRTLRRQSDSIDWKKVIEVSRK